jgi:23S rRNA (guanosine2251-2'-O)-methyltransferase
MIIYGINPVIEALKAGRVVRVKIGPRQDDRLKQVLTLAASRNVPIERVDSAALDRASRDGVHQGILAELTAAHDISLDALVRSIDGPPLLVVLDGIEDPHNVGAIIRTVDAAGAHGVVRQTRRAAPLDAVAAKASAGAIAHVPVVDVVNIARAIDELKALNVWTVGLAGDAEQSYDAIDFTLPTAIVLGAEGSGLRRLVQESCDYTAAIGMGGHVESLNVSVAAGVVLFEAARQRRRVKPGKS